MITSPASASRSHCAPPHASPSRDDSTCAAVLVARREASSCWNARRSSLAARAMRWVDRSRRAECGDLREQLVADDRLHHIVARALPHAPDLVGFLALRRAQDDRDAARVGVAADRARGLEAVQAGHDDVHQNEVGLQLFRLEDRVLAVVARDDVVPGLGEQVVQHVPFRRRIVDDEDFLDGHGPYLFPLSTGAAARAGERPRVPAMPPRPASRARPPP